MAQVSITDSYKTKGEDGKFHEKVYFGSQANFIVVRRPESNNYEDLQSYIENLNTKIKNSVLWERF